MMCFFATKFVEGLKPHIRNALVLHKPRTVDAALSLALMQEELLDNNLKRYSYRAAKNSVKMSSDIEKPSSSHDKGLLGSTPVAAKPTPRQQGNSKFDSLRAQRKARGECFKCGAKYGPNHRCPEHVPLHVLEELFEVIQVDQEDAHSEWAAQGVMGKKTIRLQGLIGGKEVLILVDSGSSANFISESLAQQLKCPLVDIPATAVTVANSGKLTTTQKVQGLAWWT
ncbi:hypothetical protein PVAP13_4KG140105 [Panicum virgatum]|uniref:Uncharacterized protein n=1 Tax=Panicum virgatum TaxID=38727 RepID=A0A8T0TJT9_PANVG|nr:hypothetical protein PVAP13_4KG140105 [Panicum virgatum]